MTEQTEKPQMNNTQLTVQFNDFLKRCEAAKVVITEQDKVMIEGVMRIIAPPALRRAETPMDILAKVLSTNPSAPDHQKYLLCDGNIVVSSDGHRIAMVDSRDLELGVYTSDLRKVPHEGVMDLSGYVDQIPTDYANSMMVDHGDCSVETKSDDDGKITTRYINVRNKLKFNVEHFAAFTNGEDKFMIKYNDHHKSQPCQIINPKFPEMTLIIMNLLV